MIYKEYEIMDNSLDIIKKIRNNKYINCFCFWKYLILLLNIQKTILDEYQTNLDYLQFEMLYHLIINLGYLIIYNFFWKTNGIKIQKKNNN